MSDDLAEVFGDSICVDLRYPRTKANPKAVVVGLEDVRAADNVRISYDFERDGWRVEQPSRSRWDIDEPQDDGWVEVGFFQAWQKNVDGDAP